VPELRNYTDDARKALLRIAWLAARHTTSNLRKGGDRHIGVGLRGIALYGGVAVGNGNDEDPTLAVTDDDGRTKLRVLFG